MFFTVARNIKDRERAREEIHRHVATEATTETHAKEFFKHLKHFL